jgi:hypothetical protein
MTAPQLSPHLSDERLDDYVDGVLAPADRDAATVHLGGCASCASRLEELRALLTLSAAERRAVEPPAELWPLVVASTVAWPQMRRRLLRSLRVPLAAAAIALVMLSVATTSWIVERVSTGSVGVSSISAYVDEDASLDRALAARDHEHGPVSRERIAELRAKLAAADAAIRRAPDDEALYRALAERERVLAEIRPVLGRAPRPPRAPAPGH